MTDLIWSFAPWIVFLLAARATSFWGGIAAALVACMVVMARAVSRRRVHLLDVASVVYFVALAAVIAVTRPDDLDAWARYAQAGSHAALTLIVFGSILIRHPFTQSYARETVPKELWHTAQFRALNRQISMAWGVAFLIGTVSLIVAGSVDYRETLLRVVIPFGALAWAFKYTQQKRSGRVAAVAS